MRYRFVDCRWSLEDAEAGRRSYLEGHIPGAVFVDVDRDLAEAPGWAGRHPLPDSTRFAAAMGRAGIDAETFVVAYGALGGAERLWWLLRHFGHDACAVLDLGGWHGPLRAGEEAIEPAVFAPAERADDTVGRDELARRLADLVVVDARVARRWRGEPNAIDLVPGRIPGAISSPWNEELGQLPDGEVAVYCGSGVTACVIVHRLHLAGREARLYPGSWSEWEQYPELPVERST
jgi:thiosulfate/3-mercaptopyruvate sulfurtransferase